MIILGLTGGIATGKSNISRLFKGWNIPVIDADAISKELTQKNGEALTQIAAVFGNKVFNEDGTLNRKALGDIVFKDTLEKEKLENILHPMVYQEMEKQLKTLEQEGAKVAVIDVPLLFESGMDKMADEIWLADVPVEEQVRRLEKRSNLTKSEALERINSQWPREKKVSLADEVIDTRGTKKNTEDYVKALFSRRFYPL